MSIRAISRQSLLAVLVAQAFVVASAPALAQSVDGRNATVIEFGRKLGELRQTGPGQWAEINASGQVAFRFEETKRDESSVYLLDRGRNVTLQIDLRTRKVMYSAGGGAPSELYAVLSAAATPAAPAAGAAGGTALCVINSGTHVSSFDGATFDNFARNGFSMVDSDALTVQLRREPYTANPSMFIAASVALRAGGTVFVIDKAGPTMKSAASAGVVVSASGKPGELTEFRMQDGSLVKVARMESGSQTHFNVQVTVPASAKGKVRGLCGNFDGNKADDLPTSSAATSFIVPDNRNLFSCGAGCGGFK